MSDETKSNDIKEDTKPEVDELDPSEFEEEALADQGELDDVTLEEYHKLIPPTQDIRSIGEALNHKAKIMDPDEFAKLISRVNTHEGILKRMIDSHTEQTQFLKEALGKLNVKQSGDEYKHVGTEGDDNDPSFHLRNKTLNSTKSLGGKEVSGKMAKLLILSGRRNIKRIYLYNSGFHIMLRAPSLSEINLVYNRLSDKMGEYGKQYGAVFYMYSDFIIKELTWDFIESLVIDSNLNKWDKGNKLKHSVDFLDYNPIVNSIGTLMFKNGYRFVHACVKDGCNHVYEEDVDLSLLQLTDFSKIPHELLTNIANSKKVTSADVVAYKKKLGIRDNITVGGYRIYRKTPSIAEYLLHGEAFNEELAMSIKDIANSDYVDQYLRFNYSRLFLPWISHIEALDDQGEVSFKLMDKESISIALNELQATESMDEFRVKMNDYIQNSMITQIGYLAKPCTKCGSELTNATNGIVPFDAQNSFFTMLVMRLIQAS